MSIDQLFEQLSPERKAELVAALNMRHERFFFVGEEFIGVHVTATHLKITDRQSYWSKGVKKNGKDT